MSTLQLSLVSLTIAILFIQYCRASLKLSAAKKEVEKAETRADTAEKNNLMAQRRWRGYKEHINELYAKDKREKALRETLTSVKLHCRIPMYSGHQKTEFKLGLGPCGLTVDKLMFTEQDDKFTITQICTNGERKTFDYYKADVAGRIEKRWAA